MKFIIVLFAVYCVTIAKEEEKIKNHRFFEAAVITQLFELLRLLIDEGSLTNNVPVLDPLHIQHQKISKVDQQLSNFPRDKKLFMIMALQKNVKKIIEAELSNVTFSGLRDFELVDTTFYKIDVSLDLNIRFPSLTLISEHYNMDGNIYGVLPLIGHGLLHFEAHNLTFCSKIHLKQSDDGKSILIRDFSNTQYKIDRIVSRTQFDGNIDHILNAIIEDLLADYLFRFNKYIIAQHEHDAIQFFNHYLNFFESWRFIAAIL